MIDSPDDKAATSEAGTEEDLPKAQQNRIVVHQNTLQTKQLLGLMQTEGNIETDLNELTQKPRSH